MESWNSKNSKSTNFFGNYVLTKNCCFNCEHSLLDFTRFHLHQVDMAEVGWQVISEINLPAVGVGV